MKETGIFRRVDDLGRVVIPKDIRRQLRGGLMSMISRELEVLDDLANDLEVDMYSVNELNKFFADAKRIIEMLSEKAKPQQWIPVSERLPGEPKENQLFENKPVELYLVSVKDAEYPIRAFWNGKNFTGGWMRLDVIAWMELPEPYKEE